jgi:Mrp family chromosome partitioning ATPase/capsular polysaccharide biosynthesis protein
MAARRDGALVFGAVVLVFAAYALFGAATYRARATVLIRVETGRSAPSWPAPLQAAARLKAELLEPDLLDEIARGERGLPGETRALTAQRIGESLEVTSTDARRFVISADGPTAAAAQRLASQFAERAANESSAIFARASASPAGTELRATFVRAPMPRAPVRPDRFLVMMVGLTIGVVWGAGAAVGRGLWDARRARRRPVERTSAAAEPIETPPGSSPQASAARQLVAEVLRPRDESVERAHVMIRSVPAGWTPDSSLDIEARRALCDELLPFAVDGCFVLGVTAVPELDSRKPRFAAELAFALAREGHPNVLLLEADFHFPGIHRTLRFGVPKSEGFSEQLRSRGRDEAWKVVECGNALHVIAEGDAASPGILLSNQFGEAIRSLRTYYDVIVINGPLASNELDGRVLDAVVDGIVVASPPDSPYLQQALGIFRGKQFSRVVS